MLHSLLWLLVWRSAGVKVINTTALHINLLPPEERQARWPVNRIFILTGVLVVLLFILFAGYNTLVIYKLENDLTSVEQQLELLRPTQEKMIQSNSLQQLINDKTTLLTKLTAERKPWYAVITRLTVALPPQVWLEELGSGEKNIVRMKGNALTYPDLANFMQVLDKEEMFTEPTLIKAELDKQSAVTKFELTVKIKGL